MIIQTQLHIARVKGPQYGEMAEILAPCQKKWRSDESRSEKSLIFLMNLVIS